MNRRFLLSGVRELKKLLLLVSSLGPNQTNRMQFNQRRRWHWWRSFVSLLAEEEKQRMAPLSLSATTLRVCPLLDTGIKRNTWKRPPYKLCCWPQTGELKHKSIKEPPALFSVLIFSCFQNYLFRCLPFLFALVSRCRRLPLNRFLGIPLPPLDLGAWPRLETVVIIIIEPDT